MIRQPNLLMVALLLVFGSYCRGQDAFDDEAFEESEIVQRQALDERFQVAYTALNDGRQREAAKLLKQLSSEGHARSQHMMGVCYRYGIGVGVNAKRAAHWFRTSAEQGFPSAILAYGELCFSGEGTEEDFGLARALLEPLASLNWNFPIPADHYAMERSIRSRASYLTGILYADGKGVGANTDRALELMKRASSTDEAMASMYLAMAYAKGEIVERSIEESKRYFELADLQSFDGVRRSMEMAMMENADAATRKDFEAAVKELSEEFSQNLFHSQTDYAQSLLNTKSAEFDPAFARALLAMAADSGYKRAQYLLGYAHCLGLGGETDYEQGYHWLEKASSQGWTLADYNLAVLLQRGLGCSQDESRARRLLDTAAERGLYLAQLVLDGDRPAAFATDAEDVALCQEKARRDVRALYALTRRKETGWLVKSEGQTKKTLKAFRKGADAGYDRSEHAYAEYYYWSYLGDRDYKKAFKYFMRACEQGHAQSYFKIGYMYEKGFEVPKDYQMAARYYEMSVEFGDPWAANNLGALYTNGKFGAPDFETAMKLYLRSVELGNSVACFNIGTAYRFGRGVEASMEEAVSWYAKAAELGDREAAQKLVSIYENGEIDGFGDSDVAYWTEKAAQLGDTVAMFRIARRYFKGQGVPKSPYKAMSWATTYLREKKSRSMIQFGEVNIFDMFNYGASLLCAEILLDDSWSGYDPDSALEIAKSLMKDGDVEARFLFARIHRKKLVSNADPTLALKEYLALFEEGKRKEQAPATMAKAAFYLSRMYAEGVGVTQDDAERARWMKQAADIGLQKAMYLYAGYEIRGMGVAKDLEGGIHRLEELSQKGYVQATIRLGELMVEGALSADGQESLLEQLKTIASSGDARAKKVLHSMGMELEEDPEPAPATEREKSPRRSPEAFG